MKPALSESKQSSKKYSRNILFYSLSMALQLGFLIVVPILVCFFLGLFLFRHFHTSAWVLIVITAIGIAFSVYNVYRVLKQVLKQHD